MISCIWFELKALIKKPKLFLLLLSGMVIGSFALVTYYVAGTQDLQQLDTVFEQKKVVEFRAFSDSLDGEKLLALIENEELPSVKYAAVSVYNNSDYDIFAVYYSDEFDSNFSGRYIHASDMGLANCVVTYGLKDKRININENPDQGCDSVHILIGVLLFIHPFFIEVFEFSFSIFKLVIRSSHFIRI